MGTAINPPWNLRIFGDEGHPTLKYTQEQEEEARRPFPEFFRGQEH